MGPPPLLNRCGYPEPQKIAHESNFLTPHFIMKKDTSQTFKELAKLLPIVLENTHEIHIVSGQELLDQDIRTVKVDGKDVEVKADQKYQQPMPVQFTMTFCAGSVTDNRFCGSITHGVISAR